MATFDHQPVLAEHHDHGVGLEQEAIEVASVDAGPPPFGRDRGEHLLVVTAVALVALDRLLDAPAALGKEEAGLLARAVAREQLLVFRRPFHEHATGNHRQASGAVVSLASSGVISSGVIARCSTLPS